VGLVPGSSGPDLSRIDRQRARRLAATAEAIRGRDAESEAGRLDAFEQALALATERASVAFCAHDGWLDGVRAGLVSLLEFFDDEPELARYLVVHSARAGDAVLARRREVLDRIAVLLDDERAPARGYPPPLTAQAVASGVLGVLSERLSQSHPGVLVELVGPLMSFTVLPFLGASAARRELARVRGAAAGPADVADAEVLTTKAGRSSSLAESMLGIIAAEPELNSRQLASRAGVRSDAQASRLLARLQRLGLIENVRDDRRFGAKAWRLTSTGEDLEEEIRRRAEASVSPSAFDLPPELSGRLDDRAVLMLRAIGEQPWLRGTEVAARAGLQDDTRAARLLATLADLKLAVGERESHQRGTPKAWRLTAAGEQLHQRVGRGAPAPAPSVALGLMWSSGGRLGETAVAVLRVIGCEPGLSNNEIAAQVGISDENSASQLLVRLARRGLLENARNGGRCNAWQLTVSGERLERAVWQETPAALRRQLASGLLRDRGGRLNHRVVSVLGVIAAEPQLSNKEIAERVGITAKGHASTLLARLARFELIENLAVDPAPFEANAWQLTEAGDELRAAIRDARTSASAGGTRAARHGTAGDLRRLARPAPQTPKGSHE
jgi:DNA-binding MarR family transcriptional regulator